MKVLLLVGRHRRRCARSRSRRWARHGWRRVSIARTFLICPAATSCVRRQLAHASELISDRRRMHLRVSLMSCPGHWRRRRSWSGRWRRCGCGRGAAVGVGVGAGRRTAATTGRRQMSQRGTESDRQGAAVSRWQRQPCAHVARSYCCSRLLPSLCLSACRSDLLHSAFMMAEQRGGGGGGGRAVASHSCDAVWLSGAKIWIWCDVGLCYCCAMCVPSLLCRCCASSPFSRWVELAAASLAVCGRRVSAPHSDQRRRPSRIGLAAATNNNNEKQHKANTTPTHIINGTENRVQEAAAAAARIVPFAPAQSPA